MIQILSDEEIGEEEMDLPEHSGPPEVGIKLPGPWSPEQVEAILKFAAQLRASTPVVEQANPFREIED